MPPLWATRSASPDTPPHRGSPTRPFATPFQLLCQAPLHQQNRFPLTRIDVSATLLYMKTASYDEVFGAVVRLRRERRGLDSAGMAGLMGMENSSWSRMESGRTSFSPHQIARAAKVLGCAPGDLFAAAERLAAAMNASGKFRVARRGRPRDKEKAAELGMVLGGAAVIVGIALTLLGDSAGLAETEEE